jgi:hypothetical protein
VNDSNDIWSAPEVTADDAATSPTAGRSIRRAARGQKAKIAGALILGGVAGAAILGPISTLAASPAPTASSATGSGTTPAATSVPDADNRGHGPGGPGGGHIEAVTDTSVVAKAIGISEADLQTALQGGQTVAAVAKAHNVAIQTVIDALVADGQSELDAAVKAGTLTQAQADAEKATLTQRATDQANGTLQGGRH